MGGVEALSGGLRPGGDTILCAAAGAELDLFVFQRPYVCVSGWLSVEFSTVIELSFVVPIVHLSVHMSTTEWHRKAHNAQPWPNLINATSTHTFSPSYLSPNPIIKQTQMKSDM